MTPLPAILSSPRQTTARTLLFAIPAAALVLNRFPPAQYGFYPTCPIHQLTGLKCPGCGITRALAALTHGQLTEAVHDNALLLLLIPLTFYLLSRRTLPKPAWIALTAVIAAFTLARNLYAGW